MFTIIHIMFGVIKNSIKTCIIYTIRIIIQFILFSVLGWKIVNDSTCTANASKQIILYCRTSHVDILMYISWCLIRPIDNTANVVFVTCRKVPIMIINILKLFRIDLIRVDHTDNDNITQIISDHFLALDSFVFGITPYNSQNKISDIRSGFYHLAKSSKTSIVLLSLDYENQLITTTIIASPQEINIVQYDDIKCQVLDLFQKEKVLNQLNFSLTTYSNSKRSAINPKRTIIIYFLPLIVILIALQTTVSLFNLF